MKNKDKCSGCDSVCPNAEPAVDPKEVEHDVAESALEDRDDQSATCDECQDLISKSCKKSVSLRLLP